MSNEGLTIVHPVNVRICSGPSLFREKPQTFKSFIPILHSYVPVTDVLLEGLGFVVYCDILDAHHQDCFMVKVYSTCYCT